MSKSPPTLTADAATAARVLGITRRQFDRLQKAGVLPQQAPRRFDLAAVVPAFVRYVEQGREGAATLAEAKLLTERERSRKLAFENEIKAGRLIYVEQVAEVMGELAAALAGQFDALPGRVASELAGLNDPGVIRARLLDETRGIRSAMADATARLATKARGR